MAIFEAGHILPCRNVYPLLVLVGVCQVLHVLAVADAQFGNLKLLRREQHALKRADDSATAQIGQAGEANLEARMTVDNFCPEVIASISRQNLSDVASLAKCGTFGFNDEVCGYALETLAMRPWRTARIVQVCNTLAQRVGGHGAALAGSTQEGIANSLLEKSLLERAMEHADAMNLALDAVAVPKARIVKPRAECASFHQPVGVYSTLGACAEAIKEVKGEYFTYGKNSQHGACNLEKTSSKECSEGFRQTPNYDFYSLDVRENTGACERSENFCKEPGAVYEVKDCDRDGIPDPYCYGPGPGVSGYLSSKRSCVDTTPLGGCNTRMLRSAKPHGAEKLEQCITAVGLKVLMLDCKEDMPDNQNWFFAGDHLKTKENTRKCLSEDSKMVTLGNCRDDEASKWYVDRQQRVKNRRGTGCLSIDFERGTLKMDACSVDDNQRFLWAPIRSCKWSEWGEWNSCTTTCGTGTKLRYRFVAEQAENGGRDCKGPSTVADQCFSATACPIHCEYSGWQDWGECTKSCNVGVKHRERQILQHPGFGGLACDGKRKQPMVCNEKPCPLDCTWEAWTPFQACTVQCGGGEHKRSRALLSEAQHGGRPCDGEKEEAIACNLHNCPVPCKFSAWAEWSNCPLSCGGSRAQRTRVITMQAAFGGDTCNGDVLELKKCGTISCPFHCIWEAWDDWSDCSQSCGYKSGMGKRKRSYVEPKHGGRTCAGALEEDRYCNSVECPKDCKFSEWDEWSPCFKAAKDGVKGCYKRRIRQPAVFAEFGGSQCVGGDYETETCEKCMSPKEIAALNKKEQEKKEEANEKMEGAKQKEKPRAAAPAAAAL